MSSTPPATRSALRSFLLSWIDSNDLAWMPPWPVGGTPREREVRELRRQARWLIRHDLAAKHGWARILTQSLAWPAVATAKTLLFLRSQPMRFASAAWFREFAVTWWLQIFHNLRIADQSEYCLDSPARRKLTRSFLSCREQQILLERAGELRSGFPRLDQKQDFARFCELHRLPHAGTLVQGEGLRILHSTTWPGSDLVLKPGDRCQGQGVEIISHDPATGAWRAHDGTAITLETLPAYAHRRFGDGPWLLQPRLVNPPSWKPFTPGPLSTMRIVTGILSPGGKPGIVALQARFPLRHPFVDNIGAGGLSHSVDPDTGRLSIGLTWSGGPLYNSTHPVTGARVEGVILPDWIMLCELALRAHEAAGDWSSIGWDVASTTQGPRLIEANILWGAMSFLPQGRMPFIEVMKTVFGPGYERLHSQK